MKYGLTIRQLEPFTEEELNERSRNRNYPIQTYPGNNYSSKPFHEIKVLNVEVTEEEFKAIKKAVIDIF